MVKGREMTAVIWKEEEQFVRTEGAEQCPAGHSISLCPQFDISSFGKSQEEALENLKDAVKLFLL